MRIERRMILPPLIVFGVEADPARYKRELLLNRTEIATLRSAERIAAKARSVLAAECGCEHVEFSELWGDDLELARLEHAASQLAEDGGVTLP